MPSPAPHPSPFWIRMRLAGWFGEMSLDARDPDYGSLLTWAVCEAPSMVEALLREGADPNASMESSRHTTPLMGACLSGQVALAKALLDAGANPNGTDLSGSLPLTAVMVRGNGASENFPTLSLLEALLSGGANPNAMRFQQSPLQAAILHYPEAVPLLLSAGADPNAVDENGNSALHLAALAPGAYAPLMAAGARLECLNHKRQTVLDVAWQAGQEAACLAAWEEVEAGRRRRQMASDLAKATSTVRSRL